MDDLRVFAKNFNLVNVHVRRKLLSFVGSVPPYRRIVYGEVLLFKNGFAPAVKNAETFYTVKAFASHVKYIVATVAVG